MLEEIRGEENPVVVVQDYHFALLPQMIKAERPDARVAIFWHIPWPNPEAFGICPWQRELLDGLLGADLVGFHIQAHCNNFLETVDRALESRIEWERFAVSRHGHLTWCDRFPISVAMESREQEAGRRRFRPARSFGMCSAPNCSRGMACGPPSWAWASTAIDYTKGIPERFRGIERFFEKYPAYRGEFTFVQIGAPSRSEIQRYHDLMVEVEARSRAHQPAVPDRRVAAHRSADAASQPRRNPALLPARRRVHGHVAARRHEPGGQGIRRGAPSDDQGVLILSRFTGACHELVDALVVNPYDTEEMAPRHPSGLEMAPEERRLRMHRMRAVVREHNIYRWAGNLIGELCEIRTPAALVKSERIYAASR